MPPPNPRPTQTTDWATSPEAEILEPLPEYKAMGYVPGQVPVAPYWNWSFNLIEKWLLFLSTIEDFLRALTLTVTGRWTFQRGLVAKSQDNVGAPVPGVPGLDVTEGATIAGGATVDGGLTVTTGGVTAAGGLTVTDGGAAITGDTSVGGALSVTGTLGASGNTTVGGTLGVTGATTVGSLASSGAVSGTTGTFTGAVSSSGLSTGGGAFTGNVTVGGTLGITGATSASSLAVTGTLTAPTISGNVNIAGTLTATAISGGGWVAVGSAGAGTFGTGFAAGSVPPAYRLTPWGDLALRGIAVITGATSNTIIILPPGFRPTVNRYGIIGYVGTGGGGYLLIEISASTGQVNVKAGTLTASTEYYLDSLRVSI